MHVRDWKMFLDRGEHEIGIAHLSPELTDYLGASSRLVFLGREYALKAVEKHNLLPDHFPVIFDAIEFGRALADQDRSITFLHFDDIAWHRWFQVSIRRGFRDRRIFVSTFYKQDAAEVRRKTRLYRMLHPGKD